MDDRRLLDRISRLTSVRETGEFGTRERRVLKEVYDCATKLMDAAMLGRRGFIPDVAVVLGSGLSGFERSVQDPVVVPFQRVGLPAPTTEGHKGEIVLGTIRGKKVAVLAGRVHYYEGYDLATVVTAVRTMAVVGSRFLLLSNAAGSLSADMRPGELMLIKDHINLMGVNPLRGENPSELGPRFPDMSDAYDPGLRQLFREAARGLGIPLREGVYLAVSGPSYETPAEIRAFKALGADAVGMSTVPEVIAARHAGMWVGAVSCITNLGAGLSERKLSHEEVSQVGARASVQLARLFEEVIGRLPS